jgi:hypothetical protein
VVNSVPLPAKIVHLPWWDNHHWVGVTLDINEVSFVEEKKKATNLMNVGKHEP